MFSKVLEKVPGEDLFCLHTDLPVNLSLSSRLLWAETHVHGIFNSPTICAEEERAFDVLYLGFKVKRLCGLSVLF